MVTRIITFLIFGLLSVAALPQSSQAQIGGGGKGWSLQGTDPIVVHYDGKHVTTYNPGAETGRPYFSPLVGPTGENLVRYFPDVEGYDDERTDHPHHRGLWFALGQVNGLDFWHFDETGKKPSGKIVHLGVNGVQTDQQSLTLKTKSGWFEGNTQEKKVLSDERTFRFAYDDEGSLIIDVAIKLIADSGDVQISDNKEGAWAIRTLPTLNLTGKVATGTAVNSEGIDGLKFWGKRASWVHYQGKDRAGNNIGIAVLEHPTNFRYPTWWHARDYGLIAANPFGEKSFNKEAAESAGDHTIKNGESLTLRYRNIFHTQTADAAKISAKFEAYSKEDTQ